MNDIFRKMAQKASRIAGSSGAFVAAVVVVLLWAMMGPYFDYSDTWQLVINTGTTILTFLMIFLVQNTQNRDAKAMQLKLDELIRAGKSSRNQLLDLEDLSDTEMERLHEQFQKMREKASRFQGGG
ncbi:MAG: low affinity iron permease family protein [Candidatus Moranbacteria bacterium]|nr:low affinity iron permease family protein [Candidatus Moranbacteria bacterium]